MSFVGNLYLLSSREKKIFNRSRFDKLTVIDLDFRFFWRHDVYTAAEQTVLGLQIHFINCCKMFTSTVNCTYYTEKWRLHILADTVGCVSIRRAFSRQKPQFQHSCDAFEEDNVPLEIQPGCNTDCSMLKMGVLNTSCQMKS